MVATRLQRDLLGSPLACPKPMLAVARLEDKTLGLEVEVTDAAPGVGARMIDPAAVFSEEVQVVAMSLVLSTPLLGAATTRGRCLRSCRMSWSGAVAKTV